MSQGITITINAETAEAAAKVGQFFNGLNDNISRMTGLGSALEEFGQKIAAIFTVGALIDFTKETINTAEQLGKLAQKTGVSLNTLSALRAEANRLGTPFEELQFAIGMFSDKLFQAVKVGGPALQTFRELGIQLVNSNGTLRSVDQVLAEVAQKFSQMPDGPQKTAAAIDLFGRSGRELIPILNQGAEGIERMQKSGGPFTAQMVADSTAFNQSLREVKESFELVFIAIAEKVLPKLKEMSTAFNEMTSSSLGSGLVNFGATFAMEFSKALADGIVTAATFFGEQFIRAAAAVADAFDKFLTAAVNDVILWLDKSPKLARLLGGSIQPVELSDNQGAAAEQIRLMKEGAESLKGSIDAFFDKGIAAAKSVAAASAAASSSLQAAIQYAVQAPQMLTGLLSLGAGSAGEKAPVSEGAKKLIADIEKAYQAATESKVAQLNAEEKQLKDKIDKEVLDVTLAEQEKAKVTELYAAKRTEILNKEKDAQLEIALARIQGQRTLLDKDPDITAADKKEKLLELLRQENALLEQNIELNRKRVADDSLSDEAHLAAAKKLEEVEQKRAEIQQQISTTSAQDTWGGEFKHVLTQLGDEWSSWAHQVATNFKSVFTSAVSSISTGITSLIMGTKTWGQALMQIGTSVLTSIVQAIVQMGVQWVLTHVIMSGALMAFHALARALGWEQVAETNAQEAAKAPALAMNASTASVGSYGAAAIIGIAALVAALGLGLAAALGAFEQGGFTGGREGQLAGVVHGGEFVFSAPAVRAAGAGRLSEVHNALLAGSGGGSGSVPDRLVVLDERRRLNDYERDGGFRNTVLEIQEGNKWRFRRQR